MSEGRIRRNPRDRIALRRVATAGPGATHAARTLAPGTPLVAAVLDAEGGTLTPADVEALALGAALARPAGHGLLAICPGEASPAALAAAGADRVLCIPGDRGEAVPRTVAACWSALNLSHVVATDGTAAADAVRRLAAVTGRALRANVTHLTDDGVVCLEDGGSSERRRTLAPLLLGAPGRFGRNAEAAPGEALPVDLPAIAAAPARLVDLGTERPDACSVRLAEADLILCGGAGVTDWALFHRLADALGASEAGSRVACDAGHLPRDRQVGVSGTPVTARCYIALGVSGAIQHLQGIEACATVVAVNLDPHAPIHRRADLSVVADTTAFMAALLARLEPAETARRGERADNRASEPLR